MQPTAPRVDRPGLKHVLIVKMSSVGDVVHALPVASALRRQYPSLRISWAVEDWIAPLVRGHRAIDRVVVFPRMRWPGNQLMWLKRVAQAVRDLRAESYDVSIDLQGLLKSSIVAVLSRASIRIGMQFQREGASFVSYAVPAGRPTPHAVDENLACTEFLGAAAKPVSFELAVQPNAAASIDQMLVRAGMSSGSRPIVVNPSASRTHKAWPEDRWTEIVGGVADLAPVVLVGGSDQVTRHATIARGASRPPLDVTGRTTLPELVALLDRCVMHVAPDTGSAHIAAALGRPVIGVYGPTPPSRLAPYGQQDLVVYHEGLCGIGCPRFCVLGHRCLGSVTPDEVIRRAHDVFARATSEGPRMTFPQDAK